ncbi:uncharacterized protein LOC142337647 isoform X3 [Convolutriloba macropyga]|uniref:uncharacterized protein LOC142337647 isoform X3 n=1 Tax=Convolutriloba macropyga TaxID=536237 RepID=UPI003F51FAAD
MFYMFETEEEVEEEIENKESLISRLEIRVAELDRQQRQYQQESLRLTEHRNSNSYSNFSSVDLDGIRDGAIVQQTEKLQQAKSQGQALIARLKHECLLLSRVKVKNQLENNNPISDSPQDPSVSRFTASSPTDKIANVNKSMENSTNGTTRGSPREDFLDNDELSFSPVKKRSTSFHDGRLHNANSNHSTKVSYSTTSYVWNAPQVNDDQKSGSISSSKGGDKSKQQETNAKRSGKYGDRQKQGAGSFQENVSAPDRQNNQTRTGTKPSRDRNSINNSSISPQQISSTEILTADANLSKGVKNYKNGQNFANHGSRTSEQVDNDLDGDDNKLLTKSVIHPIRSSTPSASREVLAENHEADVRTSVDNKTSDSANLTQSGIRPHETKHLQRLQDEILKESEDLIEEHYQLGESNFGDYPKEGIVNKGKISPHPQERERTDKVIQSPKLTRPNSSAEKEENTNSTITTPDDEKGANKEVNPSKSAQKSASNLQNRASKARSIHIAEPEVYLTRAVSRSESQPHFITSNNTPANSQSPKSPNQHSAHDTRRIHFQDTANHNFRDDYYDNEPLEKHYIISLQDSDDVIDRLPLSSHSRGKEVYSGVVKSTSKQNDGNSSGNSSGGNYSQSNLLQELERLRKNNMEMQSVIDQLTEEIKLRDRTQAYYDELINDLESQIQQLSTIITSKHTASLPSQSTAGEGGGGGAAGDTNSINSDFSHMTSLTSSTVPIQPATLYQCTRCEEIFKSIVQFQVHITQCLEQTLFNKDASNMRRSRSAATSRERVRDRDRSRSSSLFPPKSQESINNASNMQSQDSINTATSAATTAERPESARNEPTSAQSQSAATAPGNSTTRSISTSALFHGNNKKSHRQIAETSIDAANNITLSPKGQKVGNLTSSESISKSVRAVTPSSRSVDIKKLPSQPILNYKGSPKYEELWPSETTTSQLKHSDSMRDTFGERNFDETASSLRINASFSQQPRPSSYQQNQKNPNGKKIQKSSSDAVYIPKELRPLRPKMPPPKPEEKAVPTAASEFSTMTQPKRSPQHYNPVTLPPRGATLSAYHNSTSPNISPNASIQRSPNGSFAAGYPNHQPNDRSRPLGPPPPIPKRGEDSKQKVSEQVNKRSARSRVKDAVKSPFSSIRRRMRSMSSLERIPKNKDIARESQRISSKQNSESSWEITNGPYNQGFRPNSTLNIPQGYSPYGVSGPNSLRYLPPQRAASFYGGSLRHPGGFNPAMYRPLPPSPNTRFYNHSYKYSSNEAAAKAFLHGTGTEV